MRNLFLLAILPLTLTSCLNTSEIKPAGTLGLMVNGEFEEPPPPIAVDYMDKPVIEPNNAPLRWRMKF